MAKLCVFSPSDSPSSDVQIKNFSLRGEVKITTETDEIEAATGTFAGPTVARIRVENGDGKYAMFFITLGVNKHGQPVVEVSTERNVRGERKSVRREVTGVCDRGL